MSTDEPRGGPAESFGKHPLRTKRSDSNEAGNASVTFAVGDPVSLLREHNGIPAGSRGRVTAAYISSRVLQVTYTPVECGRPDGAILDVPTSKLARGESGGSESLRGLLRTTHFVE
jgi:hypothetical protein